MIYMLQAVARQVLDPWVPQLVHLVRGHSSAKLHDHTAMLTLVHTQHDLPF